MRRRRRNPGSATSLILVAGMLGGGYLMAQNGTLGPGAQHFVAGLLSGGGGTGPKGTYNTKNGVKTVEEMHAGLDIAAGGKWGGDGADPNDPANIAKGYAKASGGPVTPN